MAENESTGTIEQEEEYTYPVRIEEAGPGTKKVSVEIPRERIDSELDRQFKDLRKQAAIPGFRAGHVPQKLIEKRFNADVKEQVRRSLVSESYGQAVEKNNLQVIGEPEFDNPEAIQLPDEGPLNYSFKVEVQPEFTLPDTSGLTIRRVRVEIKDENVDQAMRNLREQQGVLTPVEDRATEAGDYLTADVHVKLDGNVIMHQHDAQLVVRAGRLAGVLVEDLDRQLSGMKPGDTRTITVHAPESHPDERIRGRDVQIEVSLKDLKRMEPAEVNAAFLEDLGFESEKELRDALREQMVEKVDHDVKQLMRDQVQRYLLENTKVDLPEHLSEKQTSRVVARRAVELAMRGTPRDQIEANLEQLRSGAREHVAREMKLFFVLQKLAEQEQVDVSEAELNGRIAMLAAQEGRRPEKVKQEMSADGSLANLYVQMREQRAIDKVLERSRIEEVDADEERKRVAEESKSESAAPQASADESKPQ